MRPRFLASDLVHLRPGYSVRREGEYAWPSVTELTETCLSMIPSRTSAQCSGSVGHFHDVWGRLVWEHSLCACYRQLNLMGRSGL